MVDGRLSFDVSRADVSVLAHATEDEEKVAKAVRNLFPEGAGEFMLKRQRLSGYHKDPITLMTTRIKRKREATALFRHAFGLLAPLDQQRLLDELGERLDDAGNLYIRFHKQKAFKGQGTLEEVDSIRLKFSFRVPHKVSPHEYIHSIILSLIMESPAGEV